LRATAIENGLARELTAREQQEVERLLDRFPPYFLDHPPDTVTVGVIARSLRITRPRFFRLFGDIGELLHTLFVRHLRAISRAFGDVPAGTPDRGAALRAAYLRATRTAMGTPTPLHYLWMRERRRLEEDLQAALKPMHDLIARQLAPPDVSPEAVIDLLDLPSMGPAWVERLIQALPTEDAWLSFPDRNTAEPAPPPPPPETPCAGAAALPGNPAALAFVLSAVPPRPSGFADLLGHPPHDAQDDMARLSGRAPEPLDTS
jgi:AcrR family transcriptional regulator